MILLKIFNKPLILKNNFLIPVSQFHTSKCFLIDLKWREEHKLEENPNRNFVMINKQDYSFKDGRPVPLTTGQKQRVAREKENMLNIIKLMDELDSFMERKEQKRLDEESKKQEILDRKFKPKGDKLLES